MSRFEEIKRFDAALNASEELRRDFEETCARIAKEGEARSDSEIMAKAAAELGFNISAADLERSAAELQELDLDELENVAGGGGTDEHGFDTFCITAWHCFTAVLHTESQSKEVSCWSDYNCVLWSN